MIEAMQQTDKYKLNKPGVDDPIAIAPLNENVDKVEEALDAQDARITMLEGRRIVVGVYEGISGEYISKTIELGFTPFAVYVGNAHCTGYSGVALIGQDILASGVGSNQGGHPVTIVEGGFKVTWNKACNFLHSNNTFCYVAIG